MADPTDHRGPYEPLIESTMRVATWNLWWRFGPWERRQPAILETLRRIDADVIALQEVWADSDDDQAGVLAEALGLHHTYASALELDGVRFGNALLARWPITESATISYEGDDFDHESRLAIRADVDGPRGAFQVWSTHLNWRFPDSAVRQSQVRQLCRFVADSRPRTYPAIVCGDFNADPISDEIRMMTGRAAAPVEGLAFHDAWDVGGDGGPGHTWRLDNPYAVGDLEPSRRIDYVFAGWPRAHGAGHVTSCRVAGDEPIDGIWPSDHLAVVAELRY